MYVTFFGSSANQTANHESVSFLVEANASNLLIDCGPGIVSTIQRTFHYASSIDNVLLTHTHGDHISGYAYFVWNRNFERLGNTPANDLNVFGNEESIDAAKTMLEKFYPEAKFPFNINYKILAPKQKFECGELCVNVIEAIHPIPTLSCVITHNDKTIVYSCDSLPNEDLLKLSSDADLIIHEGMFSNNSFELSRKVMHSTAADAGNFAKQANGKQLLLVHIAPEMFGKETILLEEASECFNGVISIPFCGSVYSI